MATSEALQMFLGNDSAVDLNSKTIHSFDVSQSINGFSVTMAILHLAVCITGLGGNSLVIIAILKLDKMASATTVYIFNLALADGLFMVGLPFVAFQNFQNQWIFGDLACKLVMVLDGINQFTSVFCLTVMSVDRYMALVDPLRFARWRTPKRAKIISAFLWLLSLIPVLPMALHFTVQYGLCMADMFVGKWWMTFLTYTFVLGFVLPFLVMIIFYTTLVMTLKSSRQYDRSFSSSEESQRLEKQVTKMVVAVVVVFGICWLPFYIFNFCSLSETFSRYFRTLLCPCINPARIHCNRDTEAYDLHHTNGQDEGTPQQSHITAHQ
ncbi:somatostatin receptor type 5 isoform X2 [Ictalurus furcatus]|uniref:somatostatin receptor type 5 isoform X2 n=1 Tax=Ictalurus furcatus TaxID=66913 RepID=UPI00235103A1|nr:somatostatin receptor type 5 isoform X2 [Ictalurus furcatus]